MDEDTDRHTIRLVKHAVLALLLPAVAAVGGTVAICPVTVGQGVETSMAERATRALVAAAKRLPDSAILDRSAFAQLCLEKDVVLTSQWSSRFNAAATPLGADELVLSSLLRDPPYMLLSVRRLDVRTGHVLGTSLHRLGRADEIEGVSLTAISKLWRTEPDPVEQSPGSLAHDAELESLWKLIDGTEARRLVASDIERAESVYRQYVKAAATLAEPARSELEATVVSYLTDCAELVQRAQHPPEGMAFVPEGFVEIAYPGAKPRKFRVSGFFIDKTPFTRHRYAAFLRESGAIPQPGWSGPSDDGDFPLVNVSWTEAERIAAWRGMELPTYVQWIRAVSGDGRQVYPWGNAWKPDVCNFARDPNRPVLDPVGAHPAGASPFGVLDGAGCVFEWLATGHDASYWKNAPSRDPTGPAEAPQMLTAGGSYRSPPAACSCRWINPLSPEGRRDDIGFRCVLTLK